MYVDIYFKTQMEFGIDEVEDRIEEFFERKLEVTGSGSGVDGSNIDIEIYDDDCEDIIIELKEFLKQLQLPLNTYLIIEGKREDLYD